MKTWARKTVCRALMAACLLPAVVRADSPDNWTLAGRLGLLQFVVVPEASARDGDYYRRIIDEVCADRVASCFVRFFTNSSGARLDFPLPDAVLNEPTVMFQRSAKHQREQFQWSCRLGMAESSCF
ncbi:MAG TPA: hypothetical protein VIO81_15400 [Methyloversatilis sp.]